MQLFSIKYFSKSVEMDLLCLDSYPSMIRIQGSEMNKDTNSSELVSGMIHCSYLSSKLILLYL